MPVNRGILSSTTDADGNEDYQIDQVTFEPNGDIIPKANDVNGRKKKPSRRLQLAIFTFMLLIIAVVVVLAVTLKKTDSLVETGKLHNDRKFKLDEVFGAYRPQSYGSFWISDNGYLDFGGDIKKKHVDKDDVEILLTSDEVLTSKVRPGTVVISPDDNWLLIANNTKMLYRHSFFADYWVKNFKTRSIVQIKPDNDGTHQVRLASWANNGSSLVLVYKNNVYYVPCVEEKPIRYYQLTTSGVPKEIFNGVPDWVYEEEILLSGKAFEVSDDGKYLSYVTFNASATSYFSFSIYGSSANSYPYINRIAYPKAGFANPTIKIQTINLEEVIKENITITKDFTNHTNIIIPPTAISKGDYYYAVMNWSPGNELFVQWMNRAQNESICMTYKGRTGKGTIVQSHNTPGGWIDSEFMKPIYAKDNSNYITLLPKNDFKHLAKVTMNPTSTPEIKFLTDGKYLVDEISCYNADQQILYFRSTETSPHQRHIYKMNMKTNQKTCITCGLLKDSDGTKCTYHTIAFSTKCSYAFVVCNGPYPSVTYRLRMNDLSFVNLTSNADVKERLKRRDVPISRVYTVKSDGYDIPVKEIRPADFDPKKKYPVLFSVYGGPGTQRVSERYRISLDHYIVSAIDIIVIYFDARGTGFYGYKHMFAVYKQLGKYESIDAINVAKYMQQQPYVDADKIAIWGWSYGGFYSSFVMGMPSNVIKTAVAVAPVTDWRYYDTAYTERYMGLPTKSDNLEGYESTSVIHKAKNFRGKNFLLVHGTADDNVHFQNAAQLASSLVYNKIKFRTQFYTDNRHSIKSGAHVYYLIADFLFAHLRNTQIPANSTFGFANSK